MAPQISTSPFITATTPDVPTVLPTAPAMPLSTSTGTTPATDADRKIIADNRIAKERASRAETTYNSISDPTVKQFLDIIKREHPAIFLQAAEQFYDKSIKSAI